MGKSRKPRKVQNFRADPILNGASNGNGVSVDTGVTVASSVLDTVAAQLQSVNPEDKVCACHSIANLCSQAEARARVVERKFARMCGPFLLDQDAVLVEAALGCLYTLSCQGEDTARHLVAQDVLTPLLTLVSQFNMEKIEDRQKRLRRDKIMEDGFNLLRTLLQEDDHVLDVFNKSDAILPHILQFVTGQLSAVVRVAALNLLVTACDSNPLAQRQVAPLAGTLAAMVTSSPGDQDQALVNITAALLLVTAIDRQDVFSSKFLHMKSILERVSTTIETDTTPLFEHLETSKDKQRRLKEVLKSQITAVEILTNLTSSDEKCDLQESDEEFDGDFVDADSDDMEEGHEILLGSDDKIFAQSLSALGLVPKILERSQKYLLMPSDTRNSLQENEPEVCDLLSRFVIDAYLCAANIAEMLSVPQLGGGQDFKAAWLGLCGQLCAKPTSADLADSLSAVVRSFTSQVVRAEAGVSLDNVGTGDLDQLVAVYSHYSAAEASNIRTNVVNILGSLGSAAARTVTDPTCKLVVSKLASWITDVVLNDACLRVTLEGIDKFLDLFSADETDELFAELNLLNKLKQINPAMKSRIKKEKRFLEEEDIAVANTVKLNLQRFISYKEKRMRK